MDFRQIEKDLQREFALKKMRAEKIVQQNLSRANSNGTYRELDKLERELSLEISKSKSGTQSYKNLKENLSTVRKEKIKVLKAMKLSLGDLKPKFQCEKCGDSGFVNGKPCECYKKEKNEMLTSAFGLMANENCEFSKFGTSICKNAKQAETLQKLAKFLQKWAEKYPNNEKNDIIISGQTGVGKTYLASCLFNEFLKRDVSVCFITAFDLNESFLKYHTVFDSNKTLWLNPLIDVDVLIIDDLGTEPMIKNVTENYLYLLLSERERFNRPVIITTNLNLAKIKETYDERISSRLLNKHRSQLYRIDGDDLRIQK